MYNPWSMRDLEPRVIQNHRSGGPPTSIQHLQQFSFFGERTSITVIQLNPNPPKWLVSHFNLPPSYLNSRLLIITSIFMISSSNQSNPLERKCNIERPKSNLIEKQETWKVSQILFQIPLAASPFLSAPHVHPPRPLSKSFPWNLMCEILVPFFFPFSF